MLYRHYQAHADLVAPLLTAARMAAPYWHQMGLGQLMPATIRTMAALSQLYDMAQITHKRPPWHIHEVDVGGGPVPVVEQTVLDKPFGRLLRLATEAAVQQPKVLIVAPMSGHFATLLRDTVATMLRHHDVYVTDWHNARDVPMAGGRFGLDEYTQYLIDFLEVMGPRSHVVAVCQPCVAAFAATAILSQQNHPATPASLTLMAGPIDCRINPTAVNKLANERSIEWFEDNLICEVPRPHPGAGRRVYPGFVQLSAFMNMNIERHLSAFRECYQNLLRGEVEKAEMTRQFYGEYMAVADLDADYYLETVSEIFQRYALPTGQMTFHGQPVDPGAIRRTALLTVEGERDDICAIGQTLAAQDLATRLRPYLRTHYVQPNVGHYGVFSGKRWQKDIYPIVCKVIQDSR